MNEASVAGGVCSLKKIIFVCINMLQEKIKISTATIVVQPYKTGDVFEEYLFRGILSGQAVKHRIGVYFMDDWQLMTPRITKLAKKSFPS